MLLKATYNYMDIKGSYYNEQNYFRGCLNYSQI